MEKSINPRDARWLRCLVTAAFVCVILALLSAPALAARIQGGHGTLSFMFRELTPTDLPAFIRVLYLAAMLWLPIMWLLSLAGGNWVWPMLTALLLAVDILLAVMLWRLRRRLNRDVLLKK